MMNWSKGLLVNSSVEYCHHLQMMKQQSSENFQRHLYQSRSSTNNGLQIENGGSRACHSVGFSQHHGSAMRAIFLNNLGAEKECAGTGVFLPRQIGDHSATRKKPACSSVLVPAKVIQALNLNLNDIQVHHPSHPRLSPRIVTDPAQKLHSNLKRNIHAQPMMNQELRLPNEWTMKNRNE